MCFIFSTSFESIIRGSSEGEDSPHLGIQEDGGESRFHFCHPQMQNTKVTEQSLLRFQNLFVMEVLAFYCET